VEIFAQILVVLVLARVFGEVAERLGQSATIGELLAGIILVLAALHLGGWAPFLTGLSDSPVLLHLSNLGIFFLVLMAGVEMEPREIAESSLSAFAVAFGGMLVPLLAGCTLAWLLLPESPLKLAQVLVVGIAMSITAIPATVKVLSEFDMLHTRLGETVLAAALFDDVLGLLLLAVVTAVVQTGSIPDLTAVLWLLGKVAVFFTVTVALGVHIYPRVSHGLKEMQAAALELSALVIAAVAYGLLAEALGMHWILGAFMAGLFFEGARVGEVVYRDIKLIVTAITSGILGPFFFVSIGLQVDLGAVPAVPLLIAVLAVLAFAGKVIGAGLSARLIGLPPGDALAVGTGMTSRGAVTLVVLRVAYDVGVFDVAGADDSLIVRHLFSALVIMALANTFLMPIALRAALRRQAPEASGPAPDKTTGDE
jgi:Kef-type K+ transport system membrane component KefB